MEYAVWLDTQLIDKILPHLDSSMGQDETEAVKSFVHHAVIEKLNRLDQAPLAEEVDKIAARFTDRLTPFPDKISRIKSYSYLTGSGLKTAKDWVEAHFSEKGYGAILR